MATMTASKNHPESSSDRKLDSWKRIAGYLGKTVRTVQRWEREEGLPVLRHHHQKRGTVYASTRDIDAWITARSVTNNLGVATRKRALLRFGFAIALVGVLVGSWLIFAKITQAPSEAVLSFEERPWVLQVPLENLTGDPLLTDALDYSLYQGLVATHQVSIASPERIQDTLQLMRTDLDRKLDLGLALEVCSRDTGISMVITGRVQHLGTKYTLGLEAVDARTGLTTEAISGEVTEAGDLLRLSRKLVGQLVSSVKGRPNTELELETVTTNSLRAAQLYTLANRMLVRQNLGGKDMNAAAEELLLEAVTEDPDFASAHLLLSWSIFRQRRPQADFMPHADRALELIKSATEAERFFIRGSHLNLAREFEASIPIYQALLERYPDHFWGTSNLISVLRRSNRLAEAADIFVQLADLRPTSLILNYRSAYNLAAFGDTRAELMSARAQKLITPDDWDGELGYKVFWIEASTARRAWLEGDLQVFVAELGRLDSIKDRILDTQERYKAEADLAIMELALGRSEAGRSRLDALGNDFNFRDEFLVSAAYSQGDTDALENYLDSAILTVEAHRNPYTIIPHLLVRVGRVAEARNLLDKLLLAPHIEVTLKGALALAQQNDMEEVEILAKAHAKTIFADEGYYLSSEVLAEAFLEMEMPQRAHGILESASRRRASSTGSMPAWLRNQQTLAKLLRELGEETQAAEVESELSRLLALGDEDHPIKVWLRELR
jgi:hypothetical protein